MTHPSLVDCLSELTIHSPAKQMRLWIQLKRVHTRTTALVVRTLGSQVSLLHRQSVWTPLGFFFQDILKVHKDSLSSEVFWTSLKERQTAMGEKLVKAPKQLL